MATITLPITEVRNNFLELVRDASEILERVVITKNGKPEAVLLSYEEYEGWLDTIEIARDPELMKGIAEAKKDIALGRLHSYDEVMRDIKKPGNQKIRKK